MKTLEKQVYFQDAISVDKEQNQTFEKKKNVSCLIQLKQWESGTGQVRFKKCNTVQMLMFNKTKPLNLTSTDNVDCQMDVLFIAPTAFTYCTCTVF